MFKNPQLQETVMNEIAKVVDREASKLCTSAQSKNSVAKREIQLRP